MESPLKTRRFSTLPPIPGLQLQNWNILKVRKNVMADFLLCLPHNCSGHNSDNKGKLNGPDITDKTFEINLIHSKNINPKDYSHHNQQIQDKQCLKEDITG